ncbi:hypothetical protein Bca4012_092663 [Brassica carinata]|uniref:Uncharacterized protein n=1 Tax=Brassica carinata TaxID=52824 RepID=A0A8X7TV10_BRACI|nr:hypothetical protein Bca52824_075014 [Brassica carinata]
MVSELQSVHGFILPLLELPLKLIKLASTFHGVWFLKAKSKEGKRLSAMVLQICVDTTVRVTVRALLFPSSRMVTKVRSGESNRRRRSWAPATQHVIGPSK